MNEIISVVVCTHNREEHIENCIRSLFAQTLERELFEIIIVDNASTDNTAAILERFSDEHSFRIIYEAKPGLSIARNCGWREAVGKYVAYLDDDAVASKRWLEAACWAFEHLSPKPQCLTGTITLSPEKPIPDWISKDLQVCLGYLDFGENPLEMHSPTQQIIGANCLFTRSILEQTGGFDENLGRKKTLLLSGEETQLQSMIEALGGATWFYPDVAVTHFVARERLNPRWFYRRYFWGGVSDIYMKRAGRLSGNSRIQSDDVTGQKEVGSQWKRLLSNSFWALGLASRTSVIHGRIYMSYVIGYLYGLLRTRLN